MSGKTRSSQHFFGLLLVMSCMAVLVAWTIDVPKTGAQSKKSPSGDCMGNFCKPNKHKGSPYLTDKCKEPDKKKGEKPTKDGLVGKFCAVAGNQGPATGTCLSDQPYCLGNAYGGKAIVDPSKLQQEALDKNTKEVKKILEDAIKNPDTPPEKKALAENILKNLNDGVPLDELARNALEASDKLPKLGSGKGDIGTLAPRLLELAELQNVLNDTTDPLQRAEIQESINRLNDDIRAIRELNPQESSPALELLADPKKMNLGANLNTFGADAKGPSASELAQGVGQSMIEGLQAAAETLSDALEAIGDALPTAEEFGEMLADAQEYLQDVLADAVNPDADKLTEGKIPLDAVKNALQGLEDLPLKSKDTDTAKGPDGEKLADAGKTKTDASTDTLDDARKALEEAEKRLRESADKTIKSLDSVDKRLEDVEKKLAEDAKTLAQQQKTVEDAAKELEEQVHRAKELAKKEPTLKEWANGLVDKTLKLITGQEGGGQLPTYRGENTRPVEGELKREGPIFAGFPKEKLGPLDTSLLKGVDLKPAYQPASLDDRLPPTYGSEFTDAPPYPKSSPPLTDEAGFQNIDWDQYSDLIDQRAREAELDRLTKDAEDTLKLGYDPEKIAPPPFKDLVKSGNIPKTKGSITLKAKSPTFKGILSTWNPALPGTNSGPQTSTGRRYNPNDFSLALRTDLAHEYRCGYGTGNVCQALVKTKAGEFIFDVVDNGGLRPGRVGDLNERGMREASGGRWGNNQGLIPGEITLLQGRNYPTGPVSNLAPSNFGADGPFGGNILSPNVTPFTDSFFDPPGLSPYSPAYDFGPGTSALSVGADTILGGGQEIDWGTLDVDQTPWIDSMYGDSGVYQQLGNDPDPGFENELDGNEPDPGFEQDELGKEPDQGFEQDELGNDQDPGFEQGDLGNDPDEGFEQGDLGNDPDPGFENEIDGYDPDPGFENEIDWGAYESLGYDPDPGFENELDGNDPDPGFENDIDWSAYDQQGNVPDPGFENELGGNDPDPGFENDLDGNDPDPGFENEQDGNDPDPGFENDLRGNDPDPGFENDIDWRAYQPVGNDPDPGFENQEDKTTFDLEEELTKLNNEQKLNARNAAVKRYNDAADAYKKEKSDTTLKEAGYARDEYNALEKELGKDKSYQEFYKEWAVKRDILEFEGNNLAASKKMSEELQRQADAKINAGKTSKITPLATPPSAWDQWKYNIDKSLKDNGWKSRKVPGSSDVPEAERLLPASGGAQGEDKTPQQRLADLKAASEKLKASSKEYNDRLLDHVTREYADPNVRDPRLDAAEQQYKADREAFRDAYAAAKNDLPEGVSKELEGLARQNDALVQRANEAAAGFNQRAEELRAWAEANGKTTIGSKADGDVLYKRDIPAGGKNKFADWFPVWLQERDPAVRYYEGSQGEVVDSLRATAASEQRIASAISEGLSTSPETLESSRPESPSETLEDFGPAPKKEDAAKSSVEAKDRLLKDAGKDYTKALEEYQKDAKAGKAALDKANQELTKAKADYTNAVAEAKKDGYDPKAAAEAKAESDREAARAKALSNLPKPAAEKTPSTEAEREAAREAARAKALTKLTSQPITPPAKTPETKDPSTKAPPAGKAPPYSGGGDGGGGGKGGEKGDGEGGGGGGEGGDMLGKMMEMLKGLMKPKEEKPKEETPPTQPTIDLPKPVMVSTTTPFIKTATTSSVVLPPFSLPESEPEEEKTPTIPVANGTRPVVIMIVNPKQVLYGGTSRLAWSSVHTEGCTVYDASGNPLTPSTGTDGVLPKTPPLRMTTTFSVTCEVEDGDPITARATVSVYTLPNMKANILPVPAAPKTPKAGTKTFPTTVTPTKKTTPKKTTPTPTPTPNPSSSNTPCYPDMPYDEFIACVLR